MRTTIDLPISLRQKLISEAATRNLKGFSKVIEEALELYFQTAGRQKKSIIQKLRGSLGPREYEQEMERIKEGRGNWRT